MKIGRHQKTSTVVEDHTQKYYNRSKEWVKKHELVTQIALPALLFVGSRYSDISRMLTTTTCLGLGLHYIERAYQKKNDRKAAVLPLTIGLLWTACALSFVSSNSNCPYCPPCHQSPQDKPWWKI